MSAFIKLKNQFVFPPDIVKAATVGIRGTPVDWALIDECHGPVYQSPCGEFILKRGMFTTHILPALSIPTKFIGRRTKHKGDYISKNCHLRWALQPFADPTTNASYEVLYSRYPGLKFDAHSGNMGVWQGHPILFDW